MLISTASDVELARHTGRLGLCFDIEGTNAIGQDLAGQRASPLGRSLNAGGLQPEKPRGRWVPG